MNKRLLCALLIFALLFGLCSCDVGENQPLSDICYVAVVSNSGETLAAQGYCESIGAELLEYNSSSDAVEAVRNGKADYVVLNEYEVQNVLDADSDLYYLESCEYKVESRAVFANTNESLCKEFNDAFLKLTEDGTIDNIRTTYLEGGAYQVPESTGEKGELVMVCDPVFEYRVFYDDAGVLRGTDVDIAKAVCAYLGYELVIVTTDFHNMFQEIEKGNAGFIMSGVEYTEERAEFFLFSDVYVTLYYDVYTKE